MDTNEAPAQKSSQFDSDSFSLVFVCYRFFVSVALAILLGYFLFIRRPAGFCVLFPVFYFLRGPAG